MDSSSTSLRENLLSKSPSGPAREDIIHRETCKQSPSSPTDPLQQDSSDVPLKPLQTTSKPNGHKEILIFDKKQQKWEWLYICWLFWCIYACLSTLPSGFHQFLLEDFDFEEFEGFVEVFMNRMRAPLCMTAPFWFQFIGILFKDAFIMHIGIWLVRISGLIVGIPMAIAGSLYLYAPEIHADFYNAPVKQSEKALLNIFQRTGEIFLYLLVTYGAARKYQSYLIQREELLEKSQQ